MAKNISNGISQTPPSKDTVCAWVDELRAQVRHGNFDNHALLSRCWENRRVLPQDCVDRIRIHTLVWEFHDSRGDYAAAFDALRSEQLVDNIFTEIKDAVETPEVFVAPCFPPGQLDDERAERYVLWRQKCVAVLALGLASFRLDDSSSEGQLRIAKSFIDKCLRPAGFACSGTKARLHFFLGQINEANDEIWRAYREYLASFEHGIARADERLRKASSERQQELERSFAIYCVGKLKLRLSHIEFEFGKLDGARHNAKESGLLLHTSRDRFLPFMAQLLETKIERHRKDFYPNGWQIVRRMQACRDALNEHRPFFLEASLEAVKSCVYLRHGNVPPPGDDPAFPTLEQSLTTVDAIIDEARTLHLTAIVLQALLVKARTLLRLNDLNKATMIAKEARNLANLPRFRKHHAEALFVEGKISSKRVSKAISEDDPAAYRHLSKAITLFDSALEKEHPSRMFQIACRLQIADARIRLGHCARAQRYLLEAKKLAKNVESPFLHEQLAKLQERIDRMPFCSFDLKPGFDLKKATSELETRYLENVALRLKIDPRDFLKEWSKVKKSVAPLTRDQMRTLLKNNFAID